MLTNSGVTLMGINVTYQDGNHCPTVTCDLCGEFIKDAEDGNAYWSMNGGGLPELTVRFLHKKCSILFEKCHPPQAQWAAGELDVWLYHLIENLHLNISGAANKAKYLDEI